VHPAIHAPPPRSAPRPTRAAACLAAALLAAGPSPARGAAPRTLDILEFRVEGSTVLGPLEVEGALSPFLGPGRPLEDVEAARAALEKAHLDRGHQSVAVAIPPQTVRGGVVTLQVAEGRVGRLRVRGARWFSPRDVRRLAPSVAEGTVPQFGALAQDLVALNQLPDRRVTPVLRAGVARGTVDVDLEVVDVLPLHGSLEFNNRHGASTHPARLNGALRYDNLWQAGHTLSLAFQTAPARPSDGQVLSASYVVRLARVPWLSFTASGVLQDSDVSTLGGVAVKGRGRIFGARATVTLPGTDDFFHSLGAGADWKRFREQLRLDQSALETPIAYWPLVAQYAAVWSERKAQTTATATATVSLRALGSAPDRFDAKRFRASSAFGHLRLELARSQDLPAGLQASARLSGQLAADPLVGSEQLTAGGAESVRGYLEAQASGDLGAQGSLELRSPSLSRWLGWGLLEEWRFLAFADGAHLRVRDPLPDQRGAFSLLGVGLGTRLRLGSHFLGAFDAALPLATQGASRRLHPMFHVRLWTEL
jgi:hemolysin activation/secretion protein